MELRVEDAEVISRAQKRRLADYIAAPFRRQHFAPIHAHGMAFQRLTNSLATRFCSIMFMRNRFRSSFSLAQFYPSVHFERQNRARLRESATYALSAQSGQRPVKMMSKPSIWNPWVSRTLESRPSLGISTS